jgi:LPS-assembly protein
LTLLLWATHGARAGEDEWALCDTPSYEAFEPPGPVPEQPPIEVDADLGQFNDTTGEGLFMGNVNLVYGEQRLKAEQLQYFQVKNRIRATGEVEYSADGLTIESAEAELDTETRRGSFSGARYRYGPRHARGQASRIERKSPDLYKLYDATYTTCNPGDNAWLLTGKKVTLDRKEGVGNARHAVLRIKDVPVLYSPWLQFPIDDRRKSGFLAPKFGVTDNSGTELIVPYYLNLAPNYDAVISPRYLSKRGVQWRGNIRYLFPPTKGTLDLEYLKDNDNHQNRYLIKFRDNTTLTPHWRSSIRYDDVSDSEYLEDLGASLDETSLSHLQQRVDFHYTSGFWNLLSRVQHFKTIDPTITSQNRPYKRLPQFLANARLENRRFGLGYSFRGEWVHFTRSDSTTGNRLDTIFGVDWPFVRSWVFAIPSAKLRFTNYDLDDTEAGFDSNPTRTLPILSFDSGLIFERELGEGRTSQTLEPRLYYLYVPYDNQDDISVFDTAVPEFTFSQLFRDNRFVGADRMGDANQLTTALTSRWIENRTGEERFTTSIGQILYLRDRKVTLPGEASGTNSTSPVVGELSMALKSGWSARATTRWDVHAGRHERSSLRTRYKARGNRVLNLGYSYQKGDLEQTDVSFAWPLSPQWLAVGRWNYDIRNSRNTNITAGIEYDTCCWKARLLAQRFISNVEAEFNQTIEFQVVFKGLTKVGPSIGKTLEQNILGYED